MILSFFFKFLSGVPIPANFLFTSLEVQQEQGPLVFYVGEYRVCNLIGKGGGGRVYLGVHKHTQKKAAIKICSKQMTSKELERVRMEYNVMNQLRHKNIIRLHGVFENESRLCIVMDYAEGGDLFELIKKKGKLPVDEARRLFRQLVSALSYMHSKGYMHRDIKPENCLISKEQDLLLADFGFSNFWSSWKTETEGVGSLNYASPEIISSSRSYTGPEIDVWSMGAVLYTMLTGKLPFYAADTLGVYKKIKKGAWKMEPSIRDHPEILDLLRKLLEPDPLKRATMIDIYNHPFLRGESFGCTAPSLADVVASVELSFPLPDAKLQRRQQQHKEKHISPRRRRAGKELCFNAPRESLVVIEE